ncbi:MAG: ANTAR domain-containing protein [Ruminococcus sp.]|jgi:response regulator NasT|nr:ANTAR domain-containing protein [Ruminococcus sp.]
MPDTPKLKMNILVYSHSDNFFIEIYNLLNKFPDIKTTVSSGQFNIESGFSYDVIFFDSDYERAAECAGKAAEKNIIAVIAAESADCLKYNNDKSLSEIFIIDKKFNENSFAVFANLFTAQKLIEKQKKLADAAAKKLSDIKHIDRAKWVLAKYLNLTESEAHRYIQKNAMDRRKPQIEIAKDILRTYEN